MPHKCISQISKDPDSSGHKAQLLTQHRGLRYKASLGGIHGKSQASWGNLARCCLKDEKVHIGVGIHIARWECTEKRKNSLRDGSAGRDFAVEHGGQSSISGTCLVN